MYQDTRAVGMRAGHIKTDMTKQMKPGTAAKSIEHRFIDQKELDKRVYRILHGTRSRLLLDCFARQVATHGDDVFHEQPDPLYLAIICCPYLLLCIDLCLFSLLSSALAHKFRVKTYQDIVVPVTVGI